MLIIYFAAALLATALGGMTGMGGGVIIKPVLDMLGHFDVASISLLSSATVFVMSAVSLLKQQKSPDKPSVSMVVPLAAGAAAGGILGNMLLNTLISSNADTSRITVRQNITLAALVLAILVYMQLKHKLPSPGLSGIAPSALTGLFLGAVSSFLGIGGGPINVSAIIYIFGLTTKSAAICSLLIILFSQSARLLTTALGGGFGSYDLSMLPVMLAGAVIGGYIGGVILGRVSAKTADTLFNSAQAVVLCMCAVNIVRNWSV